MALSLFLLLMDLHVSARDKQHCRKHTGRSSFSRKDLQRKNCCGSAAIGVMKLFGWERSFLFCIYIHQQSHLWTSYPLGKVGPAHQEGWLMLQSQGSRQHRGVGDYPMCPTAIPVCRVLTAGGSTLFKEVPVQPVPFLSQLLWRSARLHHLPCMVVMGSNCSCMVDTELALKAAGTSMRLITIWPDWRLHTLMIYWVCLSLSIPCGAKDRPGQRWSAVAMAAICIWLIREHDSTCPNEHWHLAENGNSPEMSQILSFHSSSSALSCCWLHSSVWESPVSSTVSD